MTDAVSTLPALSTATIWAIINDEIDDATVNQLLWHCLGYRYDVASQTWDPSNVAPEWRDEYPEPPDFIADRPPNVKLVRSTPPENKQLLKEQLGFQGYKVNELVPRKTRRAQISNWLLSYMKVNGIQEQR
ncbi:MAG: DUF1823 family protein [Leptolyngbyaceae cyanobacterium bins.302]|nr:DUF1823 family protein [Leptolyngbyaceae cyanobacterium bins.302]